MEEVTFLESTISEYRSLLSSIDGRRSQAMNTDDIRKQLVSTHDWTDKGAEAIIQLGHDYGTFMLRNALALAVVMKNEDGELEF